MGKRAINMKNPTMVYKHPGRHKIHGNMFDYKIVSAEPEEEGGESELDQALAGGWFKTTPEALEGVPSDDEPPTREELEAKATELGISFPSNIKDETLLQKINEKLGE